MLVRFYFLGNIMSKVGISAFVCLNLFLFCEGRGRRCYTCRSRGELGDCKDPFIYNGTNVDEVRGVEAAPCASGWCAKIVEGGNDDFDTATERMCVQRPPVDGEERCSETTIDRRPVYMCFCIGDLCNDASKLDKSLWAQFAIMLASIGLFRRFI